MKHAIAVVLDRPETVIGDLRYDQQGRRECAAFAYAGAWLADPERFAIDPALPLVEGSQYHAQHGEGSLFHGAIADTEPDGWGRRVILRDHARRREASRAAGASGSPPPPLGALDFLLAVNDDCRIGALRLRDEAGRFQGGGEDAVCRTPPLIELQHLLAASRAVEQSTETARDLEYLRGRGTSLGGMRPKCSIRDADGSLAIGKFPSVADERAVTKGEVLALQLARKAGIRVAEARLVYSDGIPVAVIRRFDRRADGSRIPYCSAATMLGVERDDPVEHAYTEIVEALRVHGAATQADIDKLWRRIAFSIAINNVDDHLHNHGFLHVAHGQWRLSPAFDLNPFPDRVRELKTWISPDTGPDASIAALQSVAPYFRIMPSRAEAILAEVTAAVAAWRTVGTGLGMTASELDAFADAFRMPGT
jgi:serine/threonine-protein kinase HipA